MVDGAVVADVVVDVTVVEDVVFEDTVFEDTVLEDTAFEDTVLEDTVVEDASELGSERIASSTEVIVEESVSAERSVSIASSESDPPQPAKDMAMAIAAAPQRRLITLTTPYSPHRYPRPRKR